MPTERKEIIKKYFDIAEENLHLFDRAPLLAGIKSNDKGYLVDSISSLRDSIIALYNILKEQYPDIDVHSIPLEKLN